MDQGTAAREPEARAATPACTSLFVVYRLCCGVCSPSDPCTGRKNAQLDVT